MHRHHVVRHASLATVVVAVLSLTLAGAASASWSKSGSAAGTGQAAGLTAPTTINVPASTVTNGTVAVSWSGATVPTGSTASYWVERKSGTTYSDACASSQASPITGTSCSDTAVAAGTYKYRVTTRLGTNWKAVSGDSTSSVTVAVASVTASASDTKKKTGNIVTITGSGFAPSATLTAAVSSGSVTTNIAKSTDASGNVQTGTSFVMTNPDKSGVVVTITVTDGSGTEAQTTFTTTP